MTYGGNQEQDFSSSPPLTWANGRQTTGTRPARATIRQQRGNGNGNGLPAVRGAGPQQGDTHLLEAIHQVANTRLHRLAIHQDHKLTSLLSNEAHREGGCGAEARRMFQVRSIHPQSGRL